MEPEAYFARVYECLDKAKRTRDQIERQKWIEEAVTWHAIARIAEEVSADGETLRRDEPSTFRPH
jgi:hypothetical protein